MKLLQYVVVPLFIIFMAATAATFVIYQLVNLTPGSLPMNEQAKPATYTEWLFGSYSSGGVVNGDYGDSLMQRRDAAELIQQRLPASLEIFIPAAWQSLLFGVLLGILLALLRNWLTDGFLRPFMWLGVSTPMFWLALILILIYGIQLREFPISGRCRTTLSDEGCSDPLYLILPLRSLVIVWSCTIALYIRSELLPVLKKSQSAGFKPRHAVEGIVLPVLSLIPVFFAGLASSQILIEAIFAWPGIGRLALDATASRDLPVLVGITVQVLLALIIVFFVATMLNSLTRMLLGEAPKDAPKPESASDELIIPESTSPFAESDQPPLRDTLRPLIDKLYTVVAVIAAVVLIGIVIISFVPSLVTSVDPLQSDVAARLVPPGTEDHPYGTDELGRDVQARLLAAGRVTLSVAFMSALVALVIGSVVGFVGGLFLNSIGVVLNIPINALITAISLFPSLLVLFLIVGVVQLDQSNLPLFLGLLLWDSVAILVRTKVGAMMDPQAEKQPLTSWLLLVVYALVLNTTIAMALESGLSFLGLGIQPPNASLGGMLGGARNYMMNADYLVVLPGLFLVVIAFCLNIISSRIYDSKTFTPSESR